MDSDQIVLVGSTACVALAFAALLIAMILEHRRWKGLVADEKRKQAALERRFSAVVDADAEAARIVGEASANASAAISKAAAEAEAMSISATIKSWQQSLGSEPWGDGATPDLGRRSCREEDGCP